MPSQKMVLSATHRKQGGNSRLHFIHTRRTGPAPRRPGGQPDVEPASSQPAARYEVPACSGPT